LIEFHHCERRRLKLPSIDDGPSVRPRRRKAARENRQEKEEVQNTHYEVSRPSEDFPITIIA
jgi:hypothetical protein